MLYKKNSEDLISLHFKSKEFDCQCVNSGCTVTQVSDRLLDLLEQIRVHFDSPIKINSAYRCKYHNSAIGGAKNSTHMQGLAADIVVKGVSALKVYAYVASLIPHGGVGSYLNFTHVDVRFNKARW